MSASLEEIMSFLYGVGDFVEGGVVMRQSSSTALSSAFLANLFAWSDGGS